MTNKYISLRITGICGILAPIIALTCIGLAIIYLPWFSWTDNYLSDLGGSPGDRPIYAAHGLASIIFNGGLVVAGLLGMCLAMGIRKSGLLSTPLGNMGTWILFLDACALIGIGVFPETTGAPHTFFSIVFFVLVSFSLLFIGAALIKSAEKSLGWFAMVLFIFALISVPLFFAPKPNGSNAIAEMIPIVSISIFSMVMGIKLIRLTIENDEQKIL